MNVKKRMLIGMVLSLSLVAATWAGAAAFEFSSAGHPQNHHQVTFPTQPVFLQATGSTRAVLRECGDDSHCGGGMVCITNGSHLGYCDYPSVSE